MEDPLQNADKWRGLLSHPGFQLLLEEARKSLLSRWSSLLEIPPEELPRAQGFIEGVNYVLEFADARVTEAALVVEHRRADQIAALESQRGSETLQRERRYRGVRVGADID